MNLQYELAQRSANVAKPEPLDTNLPSMLKLGQNELIQQAKEATAGEQDNDVFEKLREQLHTEAEGLKQEYIEGSCALWDQYLPEGKLRGAIAALRHGGKAGRYNDMMREQCAGQQRCTIRFQTLDAEYAKAQDEARVKDPVSLIDSLWESVEFKIRSHAQ